MTVSYEQRRAIYAVTCLKAVEAAGHVADYRRAAEDLGPRVRQNGLGQAVAFAMGWDAAKDKGKCLFRADVLRWLADFDATQLSGVAERVRKAGEAPQGRTPIELGQIVDRKEASYLLLQIEALAITGWLKRIANSYPKDSAKARAAEGPDNAA